MIQRTSKQVDHELKCVNPHYRDVATGKKLAEIRINDRDFQPNQTVMLRQYNAEFSIYSGRYLIVEIKHVLTHEQFPQGLQPGYCMFSFEVISEGFEC